LEDDRWNALQSNHLYGLDPTHPEFKKTKASNELLEALQIQTKRGIKKPEETKKRNSEDVSQLIKSVRAKTNLHLVKKRKLEPK